MTPKEKAEELYRKYEKLILTSKYHVNGFVIPEMSKGCALIAVDEILNNRSGFVDFIASDIPDPQIMCSATYWQDVKTEIQNI